MKKKRSRKTIIWIALVLLVSIVAVFAAVNLGEGQEVEVVEVKKGELQQYIEDTALVKSKDQQTIYSEGSGKITNICFNIGDTVKKGDLLLSMDKGDLELQLRGANAKIESVMAQLESTEYINYENKIKIADAAVEKARVDYETTSRNYENAKKLFEIGSISHDEMNKAQDAYKAALAAFNIEKLRLDEVKQGSPDYVKSDYVSQLEQAKVLRDSILRSIEKLEIRSTTDGVILERFVEENSIATSGSAVFVIGNVGNLEIEANILVDDGYKVNVGNKVEISGNVMDDTVLSGKVVKIAPAAKSVTSTLGVNQRRVPVTIEIAEKEVVLKPGYSVDIKIITDVKKDVIKVPDTSIFSYKGKNSVVVVEDGKTKVKEVKKGMEGDRFVEVADGIKEGDIILIKPDNDIKEGMKVKQKNTQLQD